MEYLFLSGFELTGWSTAILGIFGSGFLRLWRSMGSLASLGSLGRTLPKFEFID